MDDVIEAKPLLCGWNEHLGAHVVILVSPARPGQCLGLPVGWDAGQSIIQFLAQPNVEYPRPLTGEYITRTVGALGGVVESVTVDGIAGGCVFTTVTRICTPYGDVMTEQDGRATDAVPTALWSGAPIRVVAQVWDTAKEPIPPQLEEQYHNMDHQQWREWVEKDLDMRGFKDFTPPAPGA